MNYCGRKRPLRRKRKKSLSEKLNLSLQILIWWSCISIFDDVRWTILQVSRLFLIAVPSAICILTTVCTLLFILAVWHRIHGFDWGYNVSVSVATVPKYKDLSHYSSRVYRVQNIIFQEKALSPFSFPY